MTGVMCFCLLVCVMSRAALCWISCRQWIVCLVNQRAKNYNCPVWRLRKSEQVVVSRSVTNLTIFPSNKLNHVDLVILKNFELINNLNSHPREVVSRYQAPQLQVGKNTHIFYLRSNICKYHHFQLICSHGDMMEPEMPEVCLDHLWTEIVFSIFSYLSFSTFQLGVYHCTMPIC